MHRDHIRIDFKRYLNTLVKKKVNGKDMIGDFDASPFQMDGPRILKDQKYVNLADPLGALRFIFFTSNLFAELIDLIKNPLNTSRHINYYGFDYIVPIFQRNPHYAALFKRYFPTKEVFGQVFRYFFKPKPHIQQEVDRSVDNDHESVDSVTGSSDHSMQIC